MYFKANFNVPIDESLIDLSYFDFDYNSITGKEIIRYKNHEFELNRNKNGNITEISFINQCTLTYDIEETFIALLINLINEDQSISLHDSNGSKEIFSKEELSKYL